MPTLTDYQTEVLEFLHDPNNIYYSVADINNYINRARLRVAAESNSIRLQLSGGTITAISVNSGGSGYAGTLTFKFTGAGQQAAATGTISGGAVNSVTLTNGGWGYITGTTTTVTATGSGGGSNATFNLTIDQSLTTVPGQEVYQFLAANILATTQTLVPGVQAIQGVFSVACAYGANAAMKPVLDYRIWSWFQAQLRSYNTGLTNYPTIWSQYSFGSGGSIYLWPLPSTPSQMDWDAYCLPVPLTSPSTPDALAYPYSTCVAYYAAHLAFFNAQRFEDSDRMKAEYKEKLLECPTMATPPMVESYYEPDTY